MRRCTFEVNSFGTAMATARIGSSSTGSHFAMPSAIACRAASLKAMSELSTLWNWPSCSVTWKSTTG